MSASIPSGRAQTLNILAMVAIAGLAFFVIVAMLLPLFSEYTFVSNFISELALGRFGFVQTLAFFAAGLGSLALALGISQATTDSWGARLGSSLVGLWAVGLILAGIFPIDAGGQPATVSGGVHFVVATVSVLFLVLGIFALFWTFKREARWRSFRSVSLVLGVSAVIMFLAVGAAQGSEWVGIIQRIFFGVLFLWLILAAVRLYLIAENTSEQRSTRVS